MPAERTDLTNQAKDSTNIQKLKNNDALCVDSVNPEIQAEITGQSERKPQNIETEPNEFQNDKPNCEAGNEPQQLEMLAKTSLLQFKQQGGQMIVNSKKEN